MKVGSLFAGIGGFDLAAERAGMEVVWQSEYNKFSSRVLAHRWPSIPNYGDIHEIEAAPTVDVLTGGFPCQDYSVAGQRGGLAGDRGALWWEYHRLIGSVRPTWVVGENVPGLISSNGGADFATIVGSLAKLGYGVAWAVLDSQYFGVPQRRRRVFIVGHSGGVPRPEALAINEGLYGHPRKVDEEGDTDPEAAPLGIGVDLFNQSVTGHLIPPLRTAEGHGAPAVLVSEPVAFMEDSQGGLRESHLIPTLTTGGGRPGMGFPAIRHFGRVRRLSAVERERAQGFPDHWTKVPGNPTSERYRQLGNAVAVPVVEWLLKRIKEAA